MFRLPALLLFLTLATAASAQPAPGADIYAPGRAIVADIGAAK